MEELSDNLERAIREVRAEVVMRTYAVALAVASILFAGNMVRNLYLGNSLSIVHTVLYLFFVTVFVFRTRVGAMRMALVIALSLYAVGAGGLFIYGIAANSAPVMMGFCFIAALFFGVYAALLTVATYVLAATLLVSGVIDLRPEADFLLHSGIGWFSAALTIAAMSGMVAAMTGQLKDRTVDLVRQQYLVARTDALTGLPNRLTLETRLQHSLEEARRGGDSVAVYYLDLDRFRTINDTLGHHVGDRLLWEVAERLRSAVRAVDTVARLGSDEFVVVQEHIATEEESTQLAGKMLELLAKGVRIEGQDLHCSVAMGIAMYPQHGADVVSLLRHADMAMAHAKLSGRNNFRFYSPEMSQVVHQRSNVEAGLRTALSSNSFLIYFQPQVGFNGQLRGYEALLRWATPDQGILEPEAFLEIAEESDLVNQIGDWVLREACRQNAAWQAAGMKRVRMCVNVSAAQFQGGKLVENVKLALRESGLAPSDLELELTESMLILDVPRAI
ncbi:MAG TPA: diguanylate cyclase, partial [Rhodocyclaceae bacterium]|nr:diguanylate cyclase [Rhodocyclaceae bacterium]